MESSKLYLKEKGIVPSISFKESPIHTVKLLKDKADKITGNDGKIVEGIRYLVEEKGEKKNFFTSSDSLIQKLSGIKEGEEVTIEMKSKKTETGFISFYEVKKSEEKINASEEEIDLEVDFPEF